MQGTTIEAERLRTDVYTAVTGTPHLGFVEPEVAVAPRPVVAAREPEIVIEPGTVMLSAADRHRQLDIVTRRLVEAVTARRAAAS